VRLPYAARGQDYRFDTAIRAVSDHALVIADLELESHD
jgi:hypothetical protein